ncbi:hypothetical protein F2P56_014366 [Juglans regia]|uniref:RING-type domain-containing protein n=1 Tax=Juglans regia TaxID=51240 RepID=A0A833XD99_JUGRE|nr:hypothetical protein F2P56_014366 [Juglans regia]
MEFIVLVIQISIITSTIAIFKEKPVWPMRIWIIGYNIGCVLSLLLLYGRYRRHLNHGDGFGLSDVEQQRGSEESSNLVGYNMNAGSIDRGASEEEISQLPSFPASNLANDHPECCICITNYLDREELRRLPCSHVFHLKCIDQWLQITSSCPLCKQELGR